jgi:hypothetical protein
MPAPVQEERKEKPLPTTTRGAVIAELRRLALTLAVLCVGTVLLALLFAWLTGEAARHTLPRAFYIVGVGAAAVGFLGGLGSRIPASRRAPVGAVTMNMSFAYGVLAAMLIGIGVGLEILL